MPDITLNEINDLIHRNRVYRSAGVRAAKLTICDASAELLEAIRDREPVAYRHNLHMEGGTISTRYTDYPAPEPFGKPGVDFDPSYTVTTEPLYLGFN